ncbi:helix-turn-helix domain-containing protein [Rothia nasimurium]|uniref:helix-turn-helix domain-containing protein n=1 Tax=Rothia nasimurium TaxID=85336 RepID=UPI00188320C0|nr:helix-turn-helix transcriptional regulator [Rothia nasimurium]
MLKLDTSVYLCKAWRVNIEQYLQHSTGLSTAKIAEKAGLTHTKLSRQFNGVSALTLDTIYQLARGLDLDFLTLAVEAQLIEEEYAQTLRTRNDITAFTDQELTAEVLRRMGSTATIDPDNPFDTNPYEPTPFAEALKTQEDYEAELAQILADVPEDYDIAARKARKLRPGEERGVEYYEG